MLHPRGKCGELGSSQVPSASAHGEACIASFMCFFNPACLEYKTREGPTTLRDEDDSKQPQPRRGDIITRSKVNPILCIPGLPTTMDAKNEPTVQHDDKQRAEQFEDAKLAATAALPTTQANEKLTFSDLWENKRVLGFCQFIYTC